VGRSLKKPLLYVAEHHVQIPVFSIWAVQCSQSFHQALEASASKNLSSRGTCHNVPGQHAGYGSVQGGFGGLTDQLDEVCFSPFA